MSRDIESIIFLAGLGAPIAIYNDFIQLLRDQIPHKTFHTLEWWQQQDFGSKELAGFLQDKHSILIGHSAGGSIALNALAHSPESIQRVIMLDSHTLKGMNKLPSIESFLAILLSQDSHEVIERVGEAYQLVVNDPAQFDRALLFVSAWVKDDLAQVFAKIESMDTHTVLHIASTDAHYKMLDEENKKEVMRFWSQHRIDAECIPMTHFDLIMPDHASSIVKAISRWLDA